MLRLTRRVDAPYTRASNAPPAAPVPEARVTRWTLAAFGLLILLGAGGVALARFFGRSGSRASILVSVVAHWLCAYVLWSFAGGLARQYGLVDTYETSWFLLLALVGVVWHYRLQIRAGREQGRAVFVGGQLLWLVIVLVQNGVFRN